VGLSGLQAQTVCRVLLEQLDVPDVAHHRVDLLVAGLTHDDVEALARWRGRLGLSDRERSRDEHLPVSAHHRELRSGRTMLHRLNKTRGAKEGVIEPSAADLIRPFVAGPNTPPRYALHFGTVDKVGVNPTSKYNTPLAVCAYPLTEEIFDQFLRIDLPFAQDTAKYLFVLEIKPDARVFYSTERFFNRGVGPEYLGADLSKIEISRGDDITATEVRNAPFSTQFFYSTRPSRYYRNKQYFVEGGTAARAAQWGHKLWKMGIDVWVDADNEGILHPGESSQVMVFNPSSYRVVLSMDNPKNKYEVRFGRDWRKRRDIDVSPVERARAGDKNLRGANLRGEYLYGANLRGANLRGADLTGAELSRAVLTSAKLNGADLTGAVLTSAKLNDAILTGAKLIKAKLQKTSLYDTNLTDANLTGATLDGAELISAKLIKAKLIKANLTGAYLTASDLTGADLTGAKLRGAFLEDIIYDDSTRWPTSVEDVLRVWRGDKNLSDANLTGANLTGANLTGANLTGAKLRGAVLDGIIYDDSTLWPDGFTPPRLRRSRRIR